MACACGGKMRWMRRRPAEVSASRTTRRSVPLCRRRTSPRFTSLSTTYVVLEDSTRMRRCTSHTGSSPLWYSTSSTPNSVVPSPKRAMLAREWRSTASNARASTIQSLRGTSARAAVGERFMLPPEPWGRVKLFPRWFEVKYLDFKTSVVGLEGGGTMVADLGLLALRVTLGVVFLGHGAQKAFGAFGGPGFAGAAGFIGSLGFRPARLWAGLAGVGQVAPRV